MLEGNVPLGSIAFWRIEHFAIVGYKPCFLKCYLCHVKHDLSVLTVSHNFVTWQQCLDGVKDMLGLLCSILFGQSVVHLCDCWIFAPI